MKLILCSLCLWIAAAAVGQESDAESKPKKQKRGKAKIDTEKVEKRRSTRCQFTQASDGRPDNETHGIQLKIGPPGVQNGHSNPAGLPPMPQDIEVSYVHPCGWEGSAGLVPGLTGGVRYRAGRIFYGSLGAAVLLTANGLGPGVYSAIGATIVRDWPVTIEAEFKQGMGVSVLYDRGDTHLIFPYAFRLGAGVYW